MEGEGQVSKFKKKKRKCKIIKKNLPKEEFLRDVKTQESRLRKRVGKFPTSCRLENSHGLRGHDTWGRTANVKSPKQA